ncbi:Clavaminate synthase-like protein [Setomelanomma holmii]|uniref:Clavaminate synthase-like protein n=1 Tax=Setomelanomma holmii TaxID=210430 RepID=A0A9P4H156_9PLEO|nr:Clavaminate synthase-like protein [Setomelanomma holmii]
MPEAADIAIVSFDNFITGADAEKRAVAKQLYEAFSTVGWVYLKDFGIPQEKLDEMFALLSYTGDGDEANGGIDHKECYEHRRFKNLSCPTEDELAGFRKTMDSFYTQCYTLGMNVLRCVAIAMELGDDFFDQITKQTDPQLRLIHYPTIERKILEQEGHARIIPHTDFGLCTLLFQDSVGGLEVDPFHTGDFKAALPARGTVLINIADLLQRLTNDRCRSTMHHVVSPKVTRDILPSRYSIPFFVHPDPDAMIDPMVKEGEAKKYEVVNAGEWRTYNTARNYAASLGAAW